MTFLYFLAPIVALVAYIGYNVITDPLKGIPGPLLARWSRLWLVWHSRKGDMPTVMIDLHRKYGPLVRTAPDEVSISDLAAVKTIYTPGTRFKKSEFYRPFNNDREFDLFGGRDERLHAQQRRLVARAYTMDSVRDNEDGVDSIIRIFLKCIDNHAGKKMDMANWLQLFAFDVIGEVTFSKKFGFLEAGKDNGSFAHINAALKSASWIGMVPQLYAINKLIQPYVGVLVDSDRSFGPMMNYAMSAIRDSQGEKNILGKLRAVHKEKPNEFTFPNMANMAVSNLFAGSDTTAISLRAIFYHLLTNPEHLQKLLHEIDTFAAAGKLSDPVQYSEAEKMPYLQAVIYEGIRLHPAVGMNLPRTVPEGGMALAGVFFPENYTVGANPWVMHRDKEVYGDDVDAFRPERWLGEGSSDMLRYYMAFGMGARGCIGRNIAWLEISKLVPTLLRRYEMEIVDTKWEYDCHFFVVQRELNMKLTPRVR
ncbi:cytochrome P450 family protein [Piedraia hortae CBS 480.64]|uniref:Cytochrome P450 family protein n=1 Tax=Piedraia hortae CBS 480.64 TaxID=1314780 RepID=A0A6A7BX13_9PEZI|nr:cytochrome P450 family protein [Piedraia hortae CBS 480.64]